MFETMNVIQMERKTDDNEQSESSGCVSIDRISSALCGKKSTDGVLSGTEAEGIETEDSKFLNFIKLRNHLKSLEFGWMKFYTFKNTKFLPGFVCPGDADGQRQAQSVRADGDVTGKTNIVFDFSQNVDDDLKDKAGKLALNKFNKKFHFSYE